MTLGETWNSRASCAWIPRRGRPPSARRRRRTARCRTHARSWRTALMRRRPACLAQASSQPTGADQSMFGTSPPLMYVSDRPAAHGSPAFCSVGVVAAVLPSVWSLYNSPLSARMTRPTTPMARDGTWTHGRFIHNEPLPRLGPLLHQRRQLGHTCLWLPRLGLQMAGPPAAPAKPPLVQQLSGPTPGSTRGPIGERCSARPM
jgi:hypothetical protein